MKPYIGSFLSCSFMLNMFRFVLNTETESAFGAERLFPVIVYAFINLYNVLINTDRQKSNIIDSVMNFRLFINIFACFRIFKRFNRIKTVGSGTRNLIVWLEGKQRWLLCHQSVRQLITKGFRGQRANIQTEMSWVLIKRPSNIPVRLRIALFNSSHVYFFRESKVNH